MSPDTEMSTADALQCGETEAAVPQMATRQKPEYFTQDHTIRDQDLPVPECTDTKTYERPDQDKDHYNRFQKPQV